MSNIWDDITLFAPREKEPISIRLDKDILEFFRSSGDGYQIRINAVLKSFIAYQKKKEEFRTSSLENFYINGGKKLFGTINVGGSLSSANYILIASLLSESPVFLSNIPSTKRIEDLCKAYENSGINISNHRSNGNLVVNFNEVN